VFLPSLPRNVEASFRDLSSEKPNTRRSSLADVVRHASGDAELRTRAIPQIEKLLRDDASAEVRSAAAVALGDLGAKEALPQLLLAVEDAHPMVRQMAINALGELGDPRGEPRLTRALSDARPEVRYQALIAYARVAVDDADVWRELRKATRDDDPAISHIALRLAEERFTEVQKKDGGVPPKAMTDRAAELLTAEHPDVAAAAAIFLGIVGDPRGEQVLVQIASGSGIGGRMPGKEEEQAAVELVGILGYTVARDALRRRAFGVARFVKDTCAFSAMVALAALGDARASGEIMKALSAKSPAAREAAVVACGRARIASARDALTRIADQDPEHADSRMAQLAREALEKLGAPGDDNKDNKEEDA
jgi:HEAT repeat protein